MWEAFWWVGRLVHRFDEHLHQRLAKTATNEQIFITLRHNLQCFSFYLWALLFNVCPLERLHTNKHNFTPTPLWWCPWRWMSVLLQLMLEMSPVNIHSEQKQAGIMGPSEWTAPAKSCSSAESNGGECVLTLTLVCIWRSLPSTIPVSADFVKKRWVSSYLCPQRAASNMLNFTCLSITLCLHQYKPSVQPVYYCERLITDDSVPNRIKIRWRMFIASAGSAV